jgi:hypothetical protein
MASYPSSKKSRRDGMIVEKIKSQTNPEGVIFYFTFEGFKLT